MDIIGQNPRDSQKQNRPLYSLLTCKLISEVLCGRTEYINSTFNKIFVSIKGFFLNLLTALDRFIYGSPDQGLNP